MVADLDMAGYKIARLKNGDASSDPSDVVNKRCVDTGLATKLNAIPQADFNINNNQIINLAPLMTRESAVTKQFWQRSDRFPVLFCFHLFLSLSDNNTLNL